MLQCVEVRCSVLQRVAMCCSVVQCVAVWCSMLQRVDLCNSLPSEISEMLAYVSVQRVSVWCSVWRCVTVCFSAVQCGAVFRSVMQYMVMC